MTTVLQDRRREFHAARTKTATDLFGAKQMLMPYRHNKMAAVTQGFEFKPGFIYTSVRAISARINQNYDGWPSAELKKSYRSFLGKPCFVNHQNFDPKKARGKVVAARYVEAGDDKYVETVMEIDAARFPKLAHEIKTGGMDSVSMGVEAGFTICSYCGNKAVDVPEFCAHVKYHKGERLPRINERTGRKEDVLIYEKCYKLGFFELSYVFDPADETAVVSRVIAAAAEDWQEKAQQENDEMNRREVEGDPNAPEWHPDYKRWQTRQWYQQHRGAAEPPPPPDEIMEGEMPTAMMPQARRRYHLGYGEVEAPEDVDTLRREDDGPDDGTDDFKHYVESPKELRGPDLDQTQQLDRVQEQEGLDAGRRVEDVEDIGGRPMAARNRRARRRQSSPGVLVDPRTGRRYVAAEEDEQEGQGAPPPDFGGGEDEGAGGPPPPPPGGDDEGGDEEPHKSDEELIQEAEQDLQMAEDEGDVPGSDAGGTDDDYSDDDELGDDGDDFDPGGPPDQGLGDDEFGGPSDDFGGEEHHPAHDGGDEDLPPWLAEAHGGAPDDSLPPPHQARRNGNYRGSNRNKRTGGSPMSLAQRGRVASTGRRRHYADDNGYTDGGPYHTDDNDQGEKEDTFISDTPGAEAVAAPTPGDGTISNTENTLVARINRASNQLRRDMIAYEQVTGRRIRAEAVESPDEVDPTVNTGPAAEELTGDGFESLGEEPTETQPKDASRHAFHAFDRWLSQATGRTARQHGNVNFIRRAAARWCKQAGVSPNVLFPTMGFVLREAQRSEGNRRSAMRRRADESLDVAAPQDRIDVEAPVRDTTDAEAQASQFDLSDFGDNAGDNLADPELSVDTQIWAPGEGDSSVKKDSNRKTDGMTAVRYAEAYIRAGLGETDTPEEKWKIAGMAMNMRHGTIADRISMLDAVNEVNQRRFAALRRSASNRSASRGLPQGLGQRQLTAGTQREAASSASDDSALFLK